MVVILMLMNGDKILGDVVESESDVKNEIISIKTPLIIREVLTQTGYQALPPLALMPTDDCVRIPLRSIMVLPCIPNKELVDLYTQLTSSIVLPKSNLVI